jgi:hypothetical protein
MVVIYQNGFSCFKKNCIYVIEECYEIEKLPW